MPVKNPARTSPKPHVPNQEPSSARGKRRSQNTPEYQQNLETRKSQSYGHRQRGSGIGSTGPFKGPSSRPAGIDNKTWRSYMEGRTKSL